VRKSWMFTPSVSPRDGVTWTHLGYGFGWGTWFNAVHTVVLALGAPKEPIPRPSTLPPDEVVAARVREVVKQAEATNPMPPAVADELLALVEEGWAVKGGFETYKAAVSLIGGMDTDRAAGVLAKRITDNWYGADEITGWMKCAPGNWRSNDSDYLFAMWLQAFPAWIALVKIGPDALSPIVTELGSHLTKPVPTPDNHWAAQSREAKTILLCAAVAAILSNRDPEPMGYVFNDPDDPKPWLLRGQPAAATWLRTAATGEKDEGRVAALLEAAWRLDAGLTIKAE
jgi:hypothetical protein